MIDLLDISNPLTKLIYPEPEHCKIAALNEINQLEGLAMSNLNTNSLSQNPNTFGLVGKYIKVTRSKHRSLNKRL